MSCEDKVWRGFFCGYGSKNWVFTKPCACGTVRVSLQDTSSGYVSMYHKGVPTGRGAPGLQRVYRMDVPKGRWGSVKGSLLCLTKASIEIHLHPMKVPTGLWGSVKGSLLSLTRASVAIHLHDMNGPTGRGGSVKGSLLSLTKASIAIHQHLMKGPTGRGGIVKASF